MDGCISPLPIFAAGNQLMVEVSAVRRNKKLKQNLKGKIASQRLPS
jgi:hypothetical protein